ncbi:hypothetical protein [Paenibacillus sp. FSL A5-0031]|uniref:hypothetical protein n=1 Tax=Paenibacillus sp. FSL A5-0031 TaxID=1920420 RepID=UPI0015C3B4D2|nr:hypothetical protein [Paenibacillus sp. FSL A5-0031]
MIESNELAFNVLLNYMYAAERETPLLKVAVTKLRLICTPAPIVQRARNVGGAEGYSVTA